MAKRETRPAGPREARGEKGPSELRVNPEARLCPKFDRTSIALFPLPAPGQMGFAVVDDCAEEHQM